MRLGRRNKTRHNVILAGLSGASVTDIFLSQSREAELGMKRRLRAGVVGAGVFGGHHARKYASLPGVQLAAVLDPHEERAEALASPLGAEVFEDLDAFLDAVDLVTVASPASTHAEIAMAALVKGRHVYVEKPLADDMGHALALVEAAKASGCVLACGHQERALLRAMGLLELPERPLRLEAVRRGTFTGRSVDVSCVLDLMVHDIDLALALDASPLASIAAYGEVEAGPLADLAQAELRFEGGMTAALEASRTAKRRSRTMRIVFPSGEVRIDFLARTLVNSTPFAFDPRFAETPHGRDPLGASVAEFVAAVRGRAERPLVTGMEAARALEVALEVDRVLAAPQPKLRLVRG
jgi:predicted dehydrogenase